MAAILFLRGSKVKVLIDCPSNLVIQSDRLRLKQVILNLAINSSKFVEEGYIRLGARVVEEHDGDVSKGASNRQSVHVFVEDSGPGVPKEKRGRLFVKFQESLDMLSQGTGIGEYSLVDLLHSVASRRIVLLVGCTISLTFFTSHYS